MIVFRDTLILASANVLTSLYAATTIFATLGFMSRRLGVDISAVVKNGEYK